jgi:hypothetical protein
MAGQPPGQRGWWWLVSACNPLLLALALRGQVGPEAQAESETARNDWHALARSPLAYVIVLAIALVLAAAIIATIR